MFLFVLVSFFGFDFDGTNGVYSGILGTGESTDEQIGHPSGNEKGYGNPNNFGYTINGERGLTQQSGLICKIPFNTGWTLLQYSLVVPDTTYNYIWVNNEAVYVSDTHINSMIFWTGVNDNGEAWFTNPTVYVNPTVNPNPIIDSTEQPQTETNTELNLNVFGLTISQTSISLLFIIFMFMLIIGLSLSMVFTKKR